MTYSSEQTKERIITCAKLEFLNKGFNDANIRDIAYKAKVTTGALYNHFKNKEMIFEVIVGNFANNLIFLYKTVHEAVEGEYSFVNEETRKGVNKGTLEVLDYLYTDFELSKLLFCCAKGSSYENFADLLIEIEEKSSIKVLKKQGFNLDKVNSFFVHVISTSGTNNMLEAIHHDLNYQEAVMYIEKIHRFYFAGSKEIIK